MPQGRLNICQFTNNLRRKRRHNQQNMHPITHCERDMIDDDDCNESWSYEITGKLEMGRSVEQTGRCWALSRSADLHMCSWVSGVEVGMKYVSISEACNLDYGTASVFYVVTRPTRAARSNRIAITIECSSWSQRLCLKSSEPDCINTGGWWWPLVVVRRQTWYIQLSVIYLIDAGVLSSFILHCDC